MGFLSNTCSHQKLAKDFVLELGQMHMEVREMVKDRAATRSLLWRWGSTTEDIGRLERDRDALRQWAEDARNTLHARRIDGLPRGGDSRDLSDVVGEAIERAQMYAAQARRIDGEIAGRLRLRNSIEDLVRQLPPMQERVVACRYAGHRPWRQIAIQLNYDEGHVRKIEAQAVDWIGERLADEVFASPRPGEGSRDCCTS